MLTIFTKYLVQYGKVCIPKVGTFELVCQPPQFDVAGKIFRPPFYITKYHPREKISEHQSDFFAWSTHSAKEKTEEEINSFGEKLKKRIELEPFQWNGFGTLRFQAHEIAFEPYQINLPSLGTVPANKVMRQNVQHSVLVGDTQMTTAEVTDALNKTETKIPIYMILGWIILVFAILVILLLLYLGNFQTSSSGLNW